MSTPAQVWDNFAGKAKPRRAVNAAGATTWLNWTQYPDHGPDESVLGPVRNRRIVELGSGSGANLAHLSTLGAARCTGVDIAPTRTAAATQQWGTPPNLEFITADAADHLAANPGAYDIAYSIFGAVWFTDPQLLLPAVHDALASRGLLAFSHLAASNAPKRTDRLITKHDLSIPRWHRVLEAAGFHDVTAEIIAGPADDQQGTLLVRARRR
jgi:SAM-dependent methyltransferase